MKLIADLHIHSHFSRATSKNLDFERLAQWAQIKGVQIVGTGDLSHPGWLQEMREKLEPAEDGLFRLRPEIAKSVRSEVPNACHGPVRFMLTGEISNIYKRHDAVRKVHNVLFAPSLEAVEGLQMALEKIGNIRSDGRPILGLDSRDLLEITLETDPRCHFIPAHIWTPWFSMLGSKSGFNSVEECFGDLTDHIFALETGLSSDPPMNWRVSNLDRYTLVSNSDAHSPQKLAREANVFTTDLAYDALFDALYTGDPDRFGGTIEFFPEEGKYHLDGHRKCSVVWEPSTTLAHDGICSVCGKKVTVGVMHRVESLADRLAGEKPARTHPYVSLVPLPEVLGEVHGVGPNTRTVQRAYFKLLDALGPELTILLEAPIEDVSAVGGDRLAQGISRMRKGHVLAKGGYDGEFGVIEVLAQEDDNHGQGDLFPLEEPAIDVRHSSIQEAESDYGRLLVSAPQPEQLGRYAEPDMHEWTPLTLFDLPAPVLDDAAWMERLNEQQRSAVSCTDAPLLISAGPGTGKTRTLTVRMAHLVRGLGVSPEAILAITFTNMAAEEMADRLALLIGDHTAARLTITTFHALGAKLLREYGNGADVSPDFAIASEQVQRTLLRQTFPEWGVQESTRYLQAISYAKSRLLSPESPEMDTVRHDLPGFASVYDAYSAALTGANLLDFDDLIAKSVQLLETDSEALRQVHERYRWISVDEYQDVNLAQYTLLRMLAAGGANLCVIGDPDQAIYGFRGADHRYFLSFGQDFAGASTLHLRHSYRSPQSLLDAASQVISRNPDREAVQIVSDFVDQVKLDVYEAPTDRAEAEHIVHMIEQMVGGTSYFSLDSGRVDYAGEDAGSVARTFGDFAVLYRLNAQSAALIEAFERSGIPYQCSATKSPYSSKEARTVLAILQLLRTPSSRLHSLIMLSALGYAVADSALAETWEETSGSNEPLAVFFQRLAGAVSPAKKRRGILRLAEYWPQLEARSQSATVIDLLDAAVDLLSTERDGDVDMGQWYERLSIRASSYGRRLDAFLDATALSSDSDFYDERADQVSLLSLHAAKGLEFPVVFLAGCEEGLLPYLPESAQRTANLEEERRLFYVGMTRAQEKLILTRAKMRFLFGQRRSWPASPYLQDIESALLEVHQHEAKSPHAPTAEELQMSLF